MALSTEVWWRFEGHLVGDRSEVLQRGWFRGEGHLGHFRVLLLVVYFVPFVCRRLSCCFGLYEFCVLASLFLVSIGACLQQGLGLLAFVSVSMGWVASHPCFGMKI